MKKKFLMRLVKLDKAFGEMIWFVPKKSIEKRKESLFTKETPIDDNTSFNQKKEEDI